MSEINPEKKSRKRLTAAGEAELSKKVAQLWNEGLSLQDIAKQCEHTLQKIKSVWADLALDKTINLREQREFSIKVETKIYRLFGTHKPDFSEVAVIKNDDNSITIRPIQ